MIREESLKQIKIKVEMRCAINIIPDTMKLRRSTVLSLSFSQCSLDPLLQCCKMEKKFYMIDPCFKKRDLSVTSLSLFLFSQGKYFETSVGHESMAKPALRHEMGGWGILFSTLVLLLSNRLPPGGSLSFQSHFFCF